MIVHLYWFAVVKNGRTTYHYSWIANLQWRQVITNESPETFIREEFGGDTNLVRGHQVMAETGYCLD